MIGGEAQMTSAQPYLIRAFFEWIVDNGLTPYLLVQAGLPEVIVPEKYVSDGRIVLNVNPNAVRHLALENDYVQFNARFDGASMRVSFPTAAVLAIYAKENGQGMNFDLIGGFAEGADAENHSSEDDKPNLVDASELPTSDSIANDPAADDRSPSDNPPTPPRPKGRPKLKLV